MHYVVPIVLKLSHMFLRTRLLLPMISRLPKDLAKYLHYLVANRTAYLEYFKWRLDYRVIFLDGERHNSLERPWGLC
ncbi:hypothetical protein OSTOST_15318, partial [Ostertagia ostertagi]